MLTEAFGHNTKPGILNIVNLHSENPALCSRAKWSVLSGRL